MALTQASALLTGSTIASSFDQLLFLDNAAGMVEATLKIVSTEVGKSALQISDEHVLIKGVDTSNAAAFAVHTTGGALIFGVAADTPAITVGVDDTGADVRVYSATTNEGLLYDASEDELGLLLTTKLKFHDIGGGEEIYASANGHLEVKAGTTLDITAPTVDINASTAVTVDTPDMQISADDDSALAITAHHNTNSKVPKLVFKKSAGTKASPGIVANGESLGKIEWYGYNTTTDSGYELGGHMHMVVDAGVAANNDMPTQWVLGLSPDGSATPTTRINILSSGAMHFYQSDGSTSQLSLDGSGNSTFGGDASFPDDEGVIFGTGGDFWFGAQAGEGGMRTYAGSTQGQGTNEGEVGWNVGDSAASYVMITSGQGDNTTTVYMRADQGDDAIDQWELNAASAYLYFDNGGNTSEQTYRLDYDGAAHADAAWNDNAWDYAELFEWKTHLDSDDAVRDLFGMSVVLDGDAVRIAEEGEEDKILGVVRPKGSTASHGDGLKWHEKYIKNVWGEYEEEGYTQVNWQEFLSNGNVSYRHAYPKDEIPEYRLKLGIGRDLDNWKKEENFELNKDGEKIPVVVPSTEEEKTASNYIERTTHKSTGETLTRKKYNPDYDPSIPYKERADRPKEWVLIGLLGQVPVRDTAVIPNHWVEMKNLESGIDKYYIFNK